MTCAGPEEPGERCRKEGIEEHDAKASERPSEEVGGFGDGQQSDENGG